jgi:O-antigen/teichoic acid export membrane protein
VALVINISGAGLAFATQVLLARLTDAATYGLYVYTLSWVAVVGLVSVMGLDSLTIRVVGEAQAGTAQTLPRYLRWVGMRLTVQFFSTSAVVILVLQSGWVSTELRDILLVGVPLLAGTSLLVVAQAALQGCGVAHARWPNQLLRPIVLASIIGLLVLLEPQWVTARGLVGASVVSVAVACVVVLVWLRRTMGGERQLRATRTDHASPGHASPDQVKADHVQTKVWGKSLWALTFVASTGLLLSQTDIVLLGIFRSQVEVGLYGAATRIANLAGFGLVAVNMIVSPILARMYSQSDRTGIQTTLHLSARMAVLFSLAVTVLLMWQAERVLALFGPEFVASVDILRILLVGQLVNAFAGSSGALMVMTGNERQAANILGVVVVLNVIANVVLIPLYGMGGAAVATAFSIAVWSVVGLVYVYRKYDFRASVI